MNKMITPKRIIQMIGAIIHSKNTRMIVIMMILKIVLMRNTIKYIKKMYKKNIMTMKKIMRIKIVIEYIYNYSFN